MFNWLKWFFASNTGVNCVWSDLPSEIRRTHLCTYDRNSIRSIEKQVSIVITTDTSVIKYTYNPITDQWQHMSEYKFKQT